MAGPYVSLQKLLGAPNMCGIIKTTVSGIPNIWKDPAFWQVDKICHGNVGTYTQYSGARQNAKVSNYGAPSSNRQLRELGQKHVTLIHSVENLILKPTDYLNLLAYDDLARQQLGIDEVTRQIEEAKFYPDNMRISAFTSMMFQGVVTWDDQGNILGPNSAGWGTGGYNSINYQVPAGNQGQLDVFGTGNPIINASWANPATNIVQQITNLKKASVQLTGYEIKSAYYGTNIGAFLAQNTFIQAYLSRAQFPGGSTEGAKFIDNGEIQKLLGLDWVPAYKSYFLDQNNNPQSFVGPDQVVFMPEPTKNWIGILEGTYPCPTRANIVTAVEPSLVSGMEERAGMFAYGVQTTDPPNVKIVYGDTMLPVLKVPNVIFQATVIPGATS